MTTTTTPDLRYPIGRFALPERVSTEERARFLDEIEAAPAALRAAVRGLSDAQLDTPYRPDGWTIRQVVHHLPDSHLQAYVRIKLALTEDEPTIKPYLEPRWAELPEARSAPIEMSLVLLESLHVRLLAALRALDAPAFSRRYTHPEHGRHFTVDQTIALYAWHGRHHVAHIQEATRRAGAAGRTR